MTSSRAAPTSAASSPDRTISPSARRSPPGMSGCSPAGTVATTSADVCTSPSVTIPLLHSTTAVLRRCRRSTPWRGDAAERDAERGGAERHGADEDPPAWPWTLRSLLAISGDPFRRRTTGPPIRMAWGRFRSGSPQAQATSSSPADQRLPVMVSCGCSNPWCSSVCSSVGSQPGYKQWQSNHREWSAVNPAPGALWRTSHTLGDPWSPLIDPFGRRVTDLRISITDRCNFRCTYCMPEEGMQWLARERAAHLRGAWPGSPGSASSASGFESVRITGGEPPVRAHLPRLIEMLAPARRRPRDDHQRRAAPGARPRPRRRRPAAHQRVARLAAARRRSSRSPAATSSTGCSPGSTPRSTPASTR